MLCPHQAVSQRPGKELLGFDCDYNYACCQWLGLLGPAKQSYDCFHVPDLGNIFAFLCQHPKSMAHRFEMISATRFLIVSRLLSWWL